MRHILTGHLSPYGHKVFTIFRLFLIFVIVSVIEGPAFSSSAYTEGDELCQPVTRAIPICAYIALDHFYRHDPRTFELLNTCRSAHPENPFPYFATALIRFRYGEYYRSVDWSEIENWIDLMGEKIETLREDFRNPETLSFAYASYYGMRSLLYTRMGRTYKAAREGKKMLKHIKQLERSLPDCPWSWYLRGTYEYFADTIPGILKVLSFILRLPGGNRMRGLALLESAAQVPSIVQVEAVRTLVYINLFYENDRVATESWSIRLLGLYPQNLTHRMFAMRNAIHSLNWLEADRHWRKWVNSALTIRGEIPERTKTETLFWRARWWAHMGHLDIARNLLIQLKQSNDDRPEWLPPWIDLTLAQIYDLQGDTARAYRLYLDILRGEDARGIHDLIRKRVRHHKPIPLEWTNY